jgi:hypothetical protein
MSEHAQEDAYFYRINRELVNQMRQPKTEVLIAIAAVSEEPVKPSRSIYDFIDEQLQPDEHWLADI